MSDEYEILPEEQQAIDNVLAFGAEKANEIKELNHRLSELRHGLREVFAENELDEVFVAIDERNDYQAYDTEAFNQITELADSLGLGFSYEDYYLWEPSTRSC